MTLERARVVDGRYNLLEPVGSGGMGTVWLAEDQRLKRLVAMKFLKAEFAGDEGLRKRFEIEAQAMAKIGHPHVAEIFDVGGDGARPYIVMEYVQGTTLTDYLGASAPLAETAAVRWLESIALGVAAIHRKNVIHRDLKPNNILIPEGGERDFRVKIVDFGIARHLESASITAEVGRLFLTPRYASPEQLAGLPLTAASDIYTLGIILVETLGAPLPPDLPALRGRISPELHALLSKMLVVDPAARPQDGAALLDLIRHLERSGETTRALSLSVAEQGQQQAANPPQAAVPVPALGLRERLAALRNRPAEELSPAGLLVELFAFLGSALIWIGRATARGTAAVGQQLSSLFRANSGRLPQAQQGARRVAGAASDRLSSALYGMVSGMVAGAIGGAFGGFGGWFFWSLTHWESLTGLGGALASVDSGQILSFFLARIAPWTLTAGFWGAIVAAQLGLLASLFNGVRGVNAERPPVAKVIYCFLYATWASISAPFVTLIHMLVAVIPLGLLALSDPEYNLVLLRVDSFGALLEDLCYWAALGAIGWAITLTTDRLFDRSLSRPYSGVLARLLSGALLGAVALGSGSYILWLVLSAVGLRESLNPETLLTHIRTDVALQVGLIGGLLLAFLQRRRARATAAAPPPPSNP